MSVIQKNNNVIDTADSHQVCYICDKMYNETLLGICKNCEELWLDQIKKFIVELPHNLPISELFYKATSTARKKYVINKLKQ